MYCTTRFSFVLVYKVYTRSGRISIINRSMRGFLTRECRACARKPLFAWLSSGWLLGFQPFGFLQSSERLSGELQKSTQFRFRIRERPWAATHNSARADRYLEIPERCMLLPTFLKERGAQQRKREPGNSSILHAAMPQGILESLLWAPNLNDFRPRQRRQ